MSLVTLQRSLYASEPSHKLSKLWEYSVYLRFWLSAFEAGEELSPAMDFCLSDLFTPAAHSPDLEWGTLQQGIGSSVRGSNVLDVFFLVLFFCLQFSAMHWCLKGLSLCNPPSTTPSFLQHSSVVFLPSFHCSTMKVIKIFSPLAADYNFFGF